MKLLPHLCILGIVFPAKGLPFVDETTARFPAESPAEYTHQVTLGDVDGDGDLDIVFANANAYEQPNPEDPVHPTRLYLNDGSGQFTDESERLGLDPGWYRDADLVDIDADGDLDLLLAGAYGHAPRLLINDGAGQYADQTEARAPAFDGFWGSGLAAADIDMDGDLDLYLTNAGSKMFSPPGGQDRLWRNTGDGYFEDVTATQLPELITRSTLDADFADLDNDGDLDILVTNRDIPSNLLLNDGGGHFQNASYLLATEGKDTRQIRAGDLNGDGWLDLVLINGSPSSLTREMVLLNSLSSASEGFVDVSDLLFGSSGGNPKADDNDAEFLDVDQDGDLDLVLAAILPGEERVLLNDGNGFLTPAEDAIDSPSDATLDLELGDLNGDKRIDLVTAQGESGVTQNRVYINTGSADTLPPQIDQIRAADAKGAYVGPVTLVARIRDGATTDTGPRLQSVTINGSPMRWAGGQLFRGALGEGLVKQPFPVQVTSTDRAGNTSTSEPVQIGPRHPLDVFPDGTINDADLNLMVDHLLDKGGLGPEGDIDSDGDVDLGDAQLLATGLANYPIVTRTQTLADGNLLVVGANFVAGVTVLVPGAVATVLDAGSYSLLIQLAGEATGALTVLSEGNSSNPMAVTP